MSALPRHAWLWGVGLALSLTGCLGPGPVPLGGLNRRLAQQGSQRDPSLSGR